MQLGDIKVPNLGSWCYTAASPTPSWEQLSKAPIWSSSIIRYAQLRATLASPMVEGASLVTQSDCYGFADTESLEPFHSIPSTTATLSIRAVIWAVEGTRPVQVMASIDDGVPALLYSASTLRMQTEVQSLREHRPDLMYHELQHYIRLKVPMPNAQYA